MKFTDRDIARELTTIVQDAAEAFDAEVDIITESTDVPQLTAYFTVTAGTQTFFVLVQERTCPRECFTCGEPEATHTDTAHEPMHIETDGCCSPN